MESWGFESSQARQQRAYRLRKLPGCEPEMPVSILAKSTKHCRCSLMDRHLRPKEIHVGSNPIGGAKQRKNCGQTTKVSIY